MRALVLGGGGVTGVAWELGLLAGLAERGLDLAGADLIVGTSAGSSVAAQITSGRPLAELVAAQHRPSEEISVRISLGTLLRWGAATAFARDQTRARAKVGRLALTARTVDEATRRAVIAARVGTDEWPTTTLKITAVRADDGEFVVFSNDSGVGLVDAVAASCAVPGVWPPVTINGRRYVDGGVRSPANVDLAAGCDQVVVLAPEPRSFRPTDSPARQAAALPARAVTISPSPAARAAIGRNVLDPARRGPAVAAGHQQAAQLAAQVAAVWS